MQQLHCEELSDLQLTMAKQEAIIECQKTEIENLREKLEETTTELADQNQQYVKVAEEFKEIQKKMEGMVILAMMGIQYIGRASTASEATLSSLQARFAVLLLY